MTDFLISQTTDRQVVSVAQQGPPGPQGPKGDAGSLGYTPVNAAGDSMTVAQGGNQMVLQITQGDTTNNPRAVLINNAGAGNALKINQTGTTSSSTSTGGALLLDNTNNPGAGMVIYSNQATPSGRLLNIRAASPTFNQAALHIDYNGTRNAFEINANSVVDDACPITVTNVNWTASTIGLWSDVENHGVIKVVHGYPSTGLGASGNDGIASMLSMDFQGIGTTCQGIFTTATTPNGGTMGRLICLQNRYNNVVREVFTVDYLGHVGICAASPGASLDVSSITLSGQTAEFPLIRMKAQTIGLAEGSTVTAWRQAQFHAPTINGVSGGGAETIGTAATVYISGAPSGADITITNAYALHVESGQSSFGGRVDVVGDISSTGIIYAASGFANKASANNCFYKATTTGAQITRNIGDANPALVVQTSHASSTGDLLQLKTSSGTPVTVSQAGKIVTSQAIRTGVFAVASLPAGVAGDRAFVDNAASPTFGATVVGGGSVKVPVYHDGTAWKVG